MYPDGAGSPSRCDFGTSRGVLFARETLTCAAWALCCKCSIESADVLKTYSIDEVDGDSAARGGSSVTRFRRGEPWGLWTALAITRMVGFVCIVAYVCIYYIHHMGRFIEMKTPHIIIIVCHKD